MTCRVSQSIPSRLPRTPEVLELLELGVELELELELYLELEVEL